MTVAVAVVAALLAAGWAFWLLAVLTERAVLTDDGDTGFRPGVSVLKPVRGLDHAAEVNFESFCRQDYPDFEIVFGVEDPQDPALPIIERLRRSHPGLPIRLVVGRVTGGNPKAALLADIAAAARHDVLVVSDSDMRVTPRYLATVVQPLADRQVGMVTCPYRAVEPLTLTARLEALYVDTHFTPAAILAGTLIGLPFGMGATVALRREDLTRLGGFGAVADHLADDHEIGRQVARLGLRVRMAPYLVSTVLGATSFRQQWQREIRWARATRASRPTLYPGFVVTFATPVAVGLTVLTGGSGTAWRALGATVAFRWTIGCFVTRIHHNAALRRWLFLLPVRDMLTAAVWVASVAGRHVSWRGRRYRVRADGTMHPAPRRSRRHR